MIGHAPPNVGVALPIDVGDSQLRHPEVYSRLFAQHNLDYPFVASDALIVETGGAARSWTTSEER